MSPFWPQKPRFRDLVLAHRKRNGMSPEAMAEALEISPSHLHALLYDRRVKPSLETAQKMAEVLGVSLLEFLDDPNQELPGTSGSSSEVDRFMLRAMGSDLSKLTEPQKKAAFEAWSAIVRGYQH